MTAHKTVVVGDPQTTFQQFVDVLAQHECLNADGRIHPHIQLIAVGDYFDFGRAGVSRKQAQAHGLAILKWLADHDEAHVHILMGNHDLCRVMELYALSDEAFDEAHALACAGDERVYRQIYPDLPPMGVVARDFSAFCVAQRRLLQSLLMARRAKLAHVVQLDVSRPVLVTHAGVTTGELAHLNCIDATPRVIAAKLNSYLDDAVDAVRQSWSDGIDAPLNLEPLHIAGGAGQEGRGLLYKRPTTKELEPNDLQQPARRFQITQLPRRLHQICGHTQHKKCQKLMPGLVDDGELSRGQIRTLTVGTDRHQYRLGAHLPQPDDACLWMVDSGLNYWPAESVDVLVC
ncbi:MAG: metallophosphoesterase [Bradymonadia bacterium]